MYYEIYIDILFLENFMVDSLLLLLIAKIQKSQDKKWRAFLGGAVGAFLTCLMVCLNLITVVEYVFSYVFISICMICTARKIKTLRQLCESMVLLYITAIMCGGVIYMMRPYIRSASILYAAVVIMYFSVDGIWKIVLNFRKQQKNICKVTLYSEKGKICLNALEDTGNQLRDPLSREPVSILSKREAEKLLDLQCTVNFEETLKDSSQNIKYRYISCRTISGESIIPVIRIKKMVIHLEEDLEIENPLFGISANLVSERQNYQIILNSDIIGGTIYVGKSGGTTAV